MRTTGDQHLVKRLNKSIVLDTIRQSSPVSRAHISELTGLNKGTVSSLVQELLDSKLAIEIGTGASSGGRKPVMLLFNKTAGYAVGIDLGVNYVRAVLTDLLGGIVREHKAPLRGTTPEAALAGLAQAARELAAGAPPSPYGIVGVGVGAPGLVGEAGRVLFAPHLGWSDVPLQAMLAGELGLPVTVDNEANAGAIGEQRFGIGRGEANLVYVSVGGGIGTGIVVGGALFRGSGGFSGEAGHMTIDANGPVCRCGNRGCWELYASETALLAGARALPLWDEARRRHADDAMIVPALVRLAEGGSAKGGGSEDVTAEDGSAQCGRAKCGCSADVRTEGSARGSSANHGGTQRGSAEDGGTQRVSAEDGGTQRGNAEDGGAQRGSADDGGAQRGSADAARLLRELGAQLGIGVASIVNALNPALVIVGGRLAEAERWVRPALEQTVRERALPYHRQGLRIAFSPDGSRSVALGGAFAAVAHFFADLQVSVQ